MSGLSKKLETITQRNVAWNCFCCSSRTFNKTIHYLSQIYSSWAQDRSLELEFAAHRIRFRTASLTVKQFPGSTAIVRWYVVLRLKEHGICFWNACNKVSLTSATPPCQLGSTQSWEESNNETKLFSRWKWWLSFLVDGHNDRYICCIDDLKTSIPRLGEDINNTRIKTINIIHISSWW